MRGETPTPNLEAYARNKLNDANHRERDSRVRAFAAGSPSPILVVRHSLAQANALE